MGQLPVIIIGGGIAGLSLALELVQRGTEVIVLEQNQMGSGASGAASAYLEPRTGTGGLRAIEWASLDQWPRYARAIEAASGTDLDYRMDGLLHVAVEDTLSRLKQDFEKRTADGTKTRWLSGDEARALEPGLSPKILAAFQMDQVHWLDGRRLCSALVNLLRKAGADLRENTAVHSVAHNGDHVRVKTDDEDLRAGKLVVCCAMGRNHIDGLPGDVPECRPVRGVMLSLATDPTNSIVRRVIKHSKGVLCPRSDGRLLIGPTSEKGETSTIVSPDVQSRLLETAVRYVPSVADLPVSEVAVGFRALVGDGALKLGQSRQMRGVYFSLSHGGSGYLRAPVVAQELADYVLDEASACALTSPYLRRLS